MKHLLAYALKLFINMVYGHFKQNKRQIEIPLSSYSYHTARRILCVR